MENQQTQKTENKKVSFDSSGEQFTEGQKNWLKIAIGETVTIKVISKPYQYARSLVIDVLKDNKEMTLGLTKNLRKVFANKKVGLTVDRVFKIERTKDYNYENDFGKVVTTSNYKINEQ